MAFREERNVTAPFCVMMKAQTDLARIYWNGIVCRQALYYSKSEPICVQIKIFFAKNDWVLPVKTQDVVENPCCAYNSEKIIIYKKGIVMYNIVTVELGIVPLEGTGIGMLS